MELVSGRPVVPAAFKVQAVGRYIDADLTSQQIALRLEREGIKITPASVFRARVLIERDRQKLQRWIASCRAQ